MTLPAWLLTPRRRAYSGSQRARMRAYFERVEPVLLLRAIVAVGAAEGRWRGSSDFASTYLVRDPRTVRRWLADKPSDRVEIPAAVVERLLGLALDMGLPTKALDAVE